MIYTIYRGRDHSIYPVCDGAIDNIKGIVSLKDIIKAKPGTALGMWLTRILCTGK
jgi:CBS domain containing-hemolysin-like protein